MKLKTPPHANLRAIGVTAVAALSAGILNAATIQKADNAENLNLPASWVGGVVPGAGDIALWDNTVTSPNTVAPGAALSLGGLKISNPAGPVQINGGSTITLGLSGLDMSAATQDLTLSTNITIGTGGVQKWTIPAGRSLTAAGVPVCPERPPASASGALEFGGAGTVKLGAGANPTLRDVAGNAFATIGQTDWAATDDAGTLIPSVYTDASTALTANVVNNIVGDTAGLGGTLDVPAIRFADPVHRTVTVASGSSSRTLTARGILVAPGSGGGTFGGNAGASFLRPNRSSTAGATLRIFQYSTVGDLNINVTVPDASSSTPVHVVKFGPGRLNFGGGVGNSIRGGLTIHDGTVGLASGTGLGSGNITLNKGTLILQTGSTLNNPAATINDGTTNIIQVLAANGTLMHARAATFNGASHLQFRFAGGVPLSTTVPPVTISNLVANGTVTIDVFNGSMAPGTYPLIYTTNSTVNFAAFSLGFLPPRVVANLANNTANGTIDLVVTQVNQPIRWATGSSTWNTTLANWVDSLSASTAYGEAGGYGDAVLFEDTVSGGSPITVSLNSTVAPASVTVNAAKNYTLSGSGVISGIGGLVKSGTGSLTLATANTFSGGVQLSGGTLVFSGLNNLGAGPIALNGGTLKFAAGNVEDISTRTVSLGGPATIDTDANTLLFAAPIGNNSVGGLTKAGSGQLTLTGTNLFSGNAVVSAGTLSFNADTYIPNSAAIIVQSGATLEAYASPLNLRAAAKQILAGSGTINSPVTVNTDTVISPATNGVIGTLTINGDLTFNGGTYAFDISGAARDSLVVNGGLTLNSGTILWITGENLPNGTYRVIDYTGALNSGAGSSANLIVAGFNQPGKVATLSDEVPGQINLVIASQGGSDIVWQGDGGANTWNIDTTPNFLKGGLPSVFLQGDKVTFDNSSINTFVNLEGALQPSSVTVNGSQNYTFASSANGRLTGTTTLTNNSTGTLAITTPNLNTGTIVNNTGTLQVGNGSATGDLGKGNIINNADLVFMQTDDRSVAGQISGPGALYQRGSAVLTLQKDNTYTGPTTIETGTLQVGTGGAAGSLGTGAVTNGGTLIYNRSGSLTVGNIKTGPYGGGAVTFAGPATVTLNGGNTYQNNTVINNGRVTLGVADAIPVGGLTTGWLVLDGGTNAGVLDIHGFDVSVNALSGLGGTVTGIITNSGTTGTNVLRIGTIPSTTTSFSGNIVENPTGAKVAVTIVGTGTNRLNGNNTYTGGTIVSETATLAFGPGAVVGNGGPITLNNGTTFFMANNGSSSSFPGNSLVVPAAATAKLGSSQQGNGYGGLAVGEASSVLSIIGPISAGNNNTKQFQSFLGTVSIDVAGSLRFSSTSLNVNGGDNTTFEVNGYLNTRNGTGSGAGVSLGAITGTGTISGAGNGDGNSVYVIGVKNINSTFSGTISGLAPRATSLLKVGTGTLTLDGTLSFDGSTTVSNGVLAIASAANSATSLDSSTAINLRSDSAVLDVTAKSDGTLTLGAVVVQPLSGFGTIRGNLMQNYNSTITGGLGVLNITGTATLAGPVTLVLNRTNDVTSSQLAAGTFNVQAGSALTVTNVGANLVNGDTFRLFNKAVTGFDSVSLPATDSTGTNVYVWNNKLAVDGTIQLTSGGLPPLNTQPAPIGAVFANNQLTLSWPEDRTGWRLLRQTNNLDKGISATLTDWDTVPGSSATNKVFITVDPGTAGGYFRMVYP